MATSAATEAKATTNIQNSLINLIDRPCSISGQGCQTPGAIHELVFKETLTTVFHRTYIQETRDAVGGTGKPAALTCRQV